MKKKEGYSMRSQLVHGPGFTSRWDFSHHVVPPLSSSTTYRLDSVKRGARGFSEFGEPISDLGEAPVYIYDRLDEPTRSLLESELASLEGGDDCAAFSSGMGAISAALGSFLCTGDHLIAHPLLYGCTHSLFTNWYPRLGIGVSRVDCNDRAAVREAVKPETRGIYIETPVNPTLELIDIEALRELADEINKDRPEERKLLIVVDNTFATPYGQRPLLLGADMVCHSLTKNLGGFGTEIGGAVICRDEEFRSLLMFRKDFGASLASKSAWAIQVYGLPTLAVRLERQQKSAKKVAKWLEEQDVVSRIHYPGLESFPQKELAKKQMRNPDGYFMPGSMIYFHLDEKKAPPIRFVNYLAKNAYCITLAVSLGHVKTLIEMPGAMTHSAYGPDDPTTQDLGIRLSLGLEEPDDIIEELQAAFEAVSR